MRNKIFIRKLLAWALMVSFVLPMGSVWGEDDNSREGGQRYFGDGRYDIEYIEVDGAGEKVRDIIKPFLLTGEVGSRVKAVDKEDKFEANGYRLLEVSPASRELELEEGVVNKIVFKYAKLEGEDFEEIRDPQNPFNPDEDTFKRYRVNSFAKSESGLNLNLASGSYVGKIDTDITFGDKGFINYKLREGDRILEIRRGSEDLSLDMEYAETRPYEINYLDENGQKIQESLEGVAELGEEIENFADELIIDQDQGVYQLKDGSIKSLVIEREKVNKVDLYYSKKILEDGNSGLYAIRYVEDLAEDGLVDLVRPLLLSGQLGTRVSVDLNLEMNRLGINYQFVSISPDSGSLILKEGEVPEIILYYERKSEDKELAEEDMKVAKYRVNYIEVDENSQPLDGHIVEGSPFLYEGKLDTNIEIFARELEGYGLIGDRSQEIYLDSENDTEDIDFKYRKLERPEVWPGVPVEPERPEVWPGLPVEPERPEVWPGLPAEPERPEVWPGFPVEPERPEVGLDPKDDQLDQPAQPEESAEAEYPKTPILTEGEKLNKEDHFAYINGYEDGSFKPENNISREELAAVFFRLLDKDYRETIRKTSHDFPDLSEKRWSAKHVGTLANGHILEGYEDGSFRPSESISRAELSTVVTRFYDLEEVKDNTFKDLDGHWAEESIKKAASRGWIDGYGDGTFRPDQPITRSEMVILVNRVLDRKVLAESIFHDVGKYKDLEDGKWYYEPVVEASVSHDYRRVTEDGYEKWIRIINPDIEM